MVGVGSRTAPLGDQEDRPEIYSTSSFSKMSHSEQKRVASGTSCMEIHEQSEAAGGESTHQFLG